MFFLYADKLEMMSSKIFTIIRQFHSNKLAPLVKCYSTSTSSTAKKDLVLIDVNDKNGFATVTLNSPPVNSLNLELLKAIHNSLDILNRDNPKGMILTTVKFKNYHSSNLKNNNFFFSPQKLFSLLELI